MTVTVAQLLALTEVHVPDDEGGLDTTQRRSSAVTTALLVHSDKAPRTIGLKVDANPVTGLTGWNEKWSKVVRAWWPYLNETAGFIAPSEVKSIVSQKVGGGDEIRLVNAPAASGNEAFVEFTAQWASADPLDLPDAHKEAAGLLAASLYAHSLAGVYESSASPGSGGLQLLDAGAKAEEYRELAKSLRTMYLQAMGLAEDEEGE